MNRVILKGRLAADPELTFSADGDGKCRFKVATDRNVKAGLDGRRPADFHPCIAWDGERSKTATLIAQHFSKGKEILVEGSYQNNNWERDGVMRYEMQLRVDRFEFCGSRGDNEAAREQPAAVGVGAAAETPATDVNDDDIPF